MGASMEPGKDRLVRFGLLADPHYARREMQINRYYRDAIVKLRSAVKVFNESDLDFLVELGDLKDMGEYPDREETLSFLDEIEKELQKFRGPVYHVLGNHDMDSISKEDFLSHAENSGFAKSRAHYSFSFREIKFIVLDANFNPDGSDYDKGNFDWKSALIPGEQLSWLEKELETKSPVVVFIHQLIDSPPTVDIHHLIHNASEVRELLEKSGQVLAVFQGHYHRGSYSYRKGIHYYTLTGMSENPLPANSFAISEMYRDLGINVQGFGAAESRCLAAEILNRTDMQRRGE